MSIRASFLPRTINTSPAFSGKVVELELCLVVRTEKAVSYLERACTAVEEEAWWIARSCGM